MSSLLLAIALSLPLAVEEPVKIVCLGDSVTLAARLGVRPEETYCALLEKQLTTANHPAKVINAGIGGNKTADGLQRFEKDVLDHHPDYVVMMFGLNDSWIDEGKTASRLSSEAYRGNLQKMCQMLRERNIKIVLMTPNPAIAPKYPPTRNVTLKAYVEAVRDLAHQEQIPLIDVYASFAELLLEGSDLNTLFTDAMHPNPAGQKWIADMLTKQFLELLNTP